MFKQSKKAFTLVELIVVITILAILGTIAFISLQGYSKSARDSRRISDVNNVKTSLELFILNAGKYPLPDSGEEVLYSGGLLWTQGIVGDVVTRNLSKNLPKKPLDPLTETEYIFSVSSTRKEFELLTYYEGITAYNLNTVNAASTYTPKVVGTYNGVFVKSSDYIVPTPSIITSEDLSLSLDLETNTGAIKSQVVTGGKNFPSINGNIITIRGELDINFKVASIITSESTKEKKLAAIKAIQDAYSGTSLASDYNYILSKTEESDKLELVEGVILNNDSRVSSNTNSEEENSISCELGYYAESSVCNQQWSGDETTGYLFKNDSGEEEYPLSCNDLLDKETWKNIFIGSPWDGDSFNDGIYYIKPDSNSAFTVYCDMNANGGGRMMAYNKIQNNVTGNYSPNVNFATTNYSLDDDIWIDIKQYYSEIRYIEGDQRLLANYRTQTVIASTNSNCPDTWIGTELGELSTRVLYYLFGNNSLMNCASGGTKWECTGYYKGGMTINKCGNNTSITSDVPTHQIWIR